jgi:hypothetical protein
MRFRFALLLPSRNGGFESEAAPAAVVNWRCSLAEGNADDHPRFAHCLAA